MARTLLASLHIVVGPCRIRLHPFDDLQSPFVAFSVAQQARVRCCAYHSRPNGNVGTKGKRTMIGARLLTAVSGAVWFLSTGGCASEVVRDPVVLSAPGSSRTLRLVSTAEILLDSGYERRLTAGTVLVEIGRVPQGQVFKPANRVFTVEGAHMHEAYPVLRGDSIIGFYLPVEKAFAPLSRSAPLHFEHPETLR